MKNYTCTHDRFTTQDVERYERAISKQVSLGKQQITISTNSRGDMLNFFVYLRSHYPSGTFSPNPNVEHFRIAIKSIKIVPEFKQNVFN